MNDKKPSHLIGLLSMDRLFIGSKSEGLYPVLHADDGKSYRLHHKGDISLNEKNLSQYDGNTVQVIGNLDNLRGHWRFVLAAGSRPLVLEASSMHSLSASTVTSETAPDASTEAVAEASASATSEIAPDLAQEELSPKTNRSKD